MEFLVWIGFLIVYSIIQSRNKKKKGQTPPVPGNTEGKTVSPTLQDALREIQEALEGRPARQEPVQPEAEKLPAAPQPRPQLKPRLEPEFHSLEKRIPERRLETKTKFENKPFARTNLESKKTYEDSFPDRSFYDDKYQHAHMDEKPEGAFAVKKKRKSSASYLRKRMREGNYLSEAFILQQILGDPLSKKR